MSLAYEVRRRARYAVVPLLCTGVLAYFGYHAVQGDRGMNAWFSLSQQIERTQAQLTLQRHEMERLEKQVMLMRANGLSRDMLDERARDVLGIAHPDDIIILGK